MLVSHLQKDLLYEYVYVSSVEVYATVDYYHRSRVDHTIVHQSGSYYIASESCYGILYLYTGQDMAPKYIL